MGQTGIVSLLIIILTFVFSYRGFTNRSFYENHLFHVDKVLINRDYKRIVTSGFLHVGWMHLIFNMLALFFFSSSMEYFLGPFLFLLIYFFSLICGNLFALFVHRRHSSYTSVGASGAIAGIIFGSIILFPDSSISLFFLPIRFPAWLFGLLYMLYSIYGIRSKKSNIGHEAHLGGGVAGMLLMTILYPKMVFDNPLPLFLILVPSLIFIIIIIYKPHVLMVDNLFYKKQHNYTVDDRYNIQKKNTQEEVDRILEKISKKGMKSLTKKEKDILNAYSKKIR